MRTTARVAWAAVLCGLLGAAGTQARAASHGHYQSGVEGMYCAGLPPPGFYYLNYDAYYSANSQRDNGGRGAGDFDLDVFVVANRFVYSSEHRLLGGRWAADALVPLVYTDITYKVGGVKYAGDNEFNLGDVFVEPFILTWEKPRWDVAFGLGGYLPVGHFDSDGAASAGKGFWTGMVTLGGTVYFDEARTWSASVLGRYQIHSKQRDTSYSPGDDLSFEWGVGKKIAGRFDVGAAGYCHWQVTDDKDGGTTLKNRYRAFAAGPEVAMAIPSWKARISLRSLWEFGVKNGSQGNFTNLTIAKAF